MPEQHQLHLPEKYAVQVRALLAQFVPDAEVWAYGSRVRGDHYAASDLDLVARFAPHHPRDPFRLSALREAFQDSNIPIIVQITDWDAIPAPFQAEIEAGYFVMHRGGV